MGTRAAVKSAAPEVVDLRAFRAQVIRRQVAHHEVDDHRADGHVHEEDPVPAHRVGDEPADGRSHEDGQAEDSPEEPLVLAPLRGREDVADDGQRDGEEGTGSQALDAARDDEPLDRWGDTGEDRPEQEDADAEQEDGPATEEVGELAVERPADGRRQEIGRDDPRVDGRCRTRSVIDARQGRADDRLVERGQEDADHDRTEDAHAHRVRQLDGGADPSRASRLRGRWQSR